MIIDIIEENIPRSIRKSIYQLLAEMYGLNSPNEFDLPDYKDFESFIEGDMELNTHILIYCQDQKAVGCLYLGNYEYDNETFYKEGCMHFSNLHVLAEYRRQGIATKLMKYAEELAKEEGIHVLSSSYDEMNKKSESVHRKSGFKVIEKTINVIKEI